LSREAVVGSALALADAEGLDAVTIRRLAADHGVTPMALYWHFKDKDVLLDGVVERVLEEVLLPSHPVEEQPAWHVRLRDICAALLEVFRRHPEVAALVHNRFLGCPAGLDLAEAFFATLSEAGFDAATRSDLGVQTLHNLVVLVAMEPGERALSQPVEEVEDRIRVKRAALQALAPQRYPNVISCASSLVESPQEDRYVALGLDVLVEGIRAVQAKLPTADPRPAS